MPTAPPVIQVQRPGDGTVHIVCTEENFAKFQEILKSTMGAMSGASKVRDLVQGGLGQLLTAAAMFRK